MSGQTPPTHAQIRALTQARLTLGAHGRPAATKTTLAFALDHARAREAVLSGLDLSRIAADLTQAGFAHRTVTSAAQNRDTFIRRPDLGRTLPEAAAESLRDAGPVDVALVLGDGLSAVAAILNGAAFLSALAARLQDRGLSHGPVILAQQARVALGDPIAQAMQAKTVVMALGERPGLSAADSLGVYITHNPLPNTPDSARNCLSNIRDAGLSIADAAAQAERLIAAMQQTGHSGVALGAAIASRALPGDDPIP